MRTITFNPRVLTLLALTGLPLAMACNSDDGTNHDDDVIVDDDDDNDNDNDNDNDTARTAMTRGIVTAELATATQVKGWFFDDDGALVEDQGAETYLEADGRFTLEVCADISNYVIEARDSDGNTVGYAVLEATGEADGYTLTTPIDQESTVEALAWMELMRDSGDIDSYSLGDLRFRVDHGIATEAFAQWQTGSSVDDIAALGAATASAQTTELWAYLDRGADTDMDEIKDYELSASQELTALLYAHISEGGVATSDAAQAIAEFNATMDAYATTQTEMADDGVADSTAMANIAFITVLQGMLGEGSPTVDAGWTAWGEIQAYATGQAMQNAYNASSKADSQLEAELEATAEALISTTYDATTYDATADAWAEFYSAAVWGADSHLFEALDLSIVSEAAYNASLESSRESKDNFYASVFANVEQDVAADFNYDHDGDVTDGDGSPEVVAGIVTTNWQTYEYDLDTWSADLDTVLSDTDVDFMSIMIGMADGSFAY